ncbi:MAG: OFA family MFS transporter [Chloroflexota bacterium]
MAHAMESRSNVGNRWGIAAAGVGMQVALGAVYAWSVFRDPLIKSAGWTISQTTIAFELTIFTLGATAFFGGLWMAKSGPRMVGIAGGVLYGSGVFLASFTGHRLWWLYLTYGIIGGMGLGLGYIVPVATLVKWFPDKRGMITGIAVAGFGAGAVLTAPIATRLIGNVGVFQTFAYLGVAYLIIVVLCALFMRNPPEGYVPAGWQESSSQAHDRATRDFTIGGALRTWQWYVLWAMLFLNVTAGIAIISQAAPMAKEITGVTALVAAGMVSAISIANGAGRFLWAWFSDAIGRKQVFLIMFLLQAVLFFLLPHVGSFALLTAVACIILLCYGGGFGTMPAFAADYFGPRYVGQVYGLMLTAWGFGAVLGPQLIATIRQHTGHYTNALYVIAGIMLVSTILPLIVRPPESGTREDGSVDIAKETRQRGSSQGSVVSASRSTAGSDIPNH